MTIIHDITHSTPWRNHRCCVAFVRHGEREPVPPDKYPPYDSPLTDNGRCEAVAFGRALGDRLGLIRSSPVPRCMDTARAILNGAGRANAPMQDRLLGDPGVFVTDPDLAMSELTARGFLAAARDLGNGVHIPGFEQPDNGACRLLALAMSLLVQTSSYIHLCVTHDLVLSTLIARLRGRPLDETEWPSYLHGVVVWNEHSRLFAFYNGEPFPIPNRLIPETF